MLKTLFTPKPVSTLRRNIVISVPVFFCRPLMANAAEHVLQSPPEVVPQETPEALTLSEHDAVYVFEAVRLSKVIEYYIEYSKENPSVVNLCQDDFLPAILNAYDKATECVSDYNVRQILRDRFATVLEHPCSPFPSL